MAIDEWRVANGSVGWRAERGTTPECVHLEASPDGARCAPTARDPDLTIHAGALGAAYLGGTPLRLAAIARGFEVHRPGALGDADTLFRTLDSPRWTTFFQDPLTLRALIPII